MSKRASRCASSISEHWTSLYVSFEKHSMFSLFKKKSELEKLQQQYEKMLAEAHRLSSIDRAASDLKQAEAAQLMDRIVALKEAEEQGS